MNLDASVGALLTVGIPAGRLTPGVAAHLRAIHAGGFIAFDRNFESPEQFRELARSLDRAMGRRLLVMVDHEGGRVVRFPHGLTQFEDALTIGRTQRPEQLEQQGRTEARELKAIGVQVNLAPCVDVLAEGSDPIIGSRSYGADAERVSALAAARIRGTQAGGVAACAKHFPGLGAVPKDPHKHLPTVMLGSPAMRATHLPPFAAAIKAGVAMVMSSHVCYPDLEGRPGWPATFSSRLITALLRQELEFGGVIVSDDMEMGAVQELCGIGEASVLAVEAGHDVLLVCNTPEAQRDAFQALRQAYHSGRLPQIGLEQRVERLAALRQRVGLSRLQ